MAVGVGTSHGGRRTSRAGWQRAAAPAGPCAHAAGAVGLWRGRRAGQQPQASGPRTQELILATCWAGAEPIRVRRSMQTCARSQARPWQWHCTGRACRLRWDIWLGDASPRSPAPGCGGAEGFFVERTDGWIYCGLLSFFVWCTTSSPVVPDDGDWRHCHYSLPLLLATAQSLTRLDAHGRLRSRSDHIPRCANSQRRTIARRNISTGNEDKTGSYDESDGLSSFSS